MDSSPVKSKSSSFKKRERRPSGSFKRLPHTSGTKQRSAEPRLKQKIPKLESEQGSRQADSLHLPSEPGTEQGPSSRGITHEDSIHLPSEPGTEQGPSSRVITHEDSIHLPSEPGTEQGPSSRVITHDEAQNSLKTTAWGIRKPLRAIDDEPRHCEENEFETKTAEKKSTKPQWVLGSESPDTPGVASQSSRTSVDPEVPARQEFRERSPQEYNRHSNPQPPAAVPAVEFDTGSDFSEGYRRAPIIYDEKSRREHQKFHDLYFIGWGFALRDGWS